MDLRGLAELLAPLFLGRLIHVVRNTDEKIRFEKEREMLFEAEERSSLEVQIKILFGR